MSKKAETTESATAAEPADKRVATIRILKTGTRAKHFTFAAGVTVPGVGMVHAEHLQASGAAEILDVK